MTQPRQGAAASLLGGRPRLGRALFYVHQQMLIITDPVTRATLGQLVAAGEAMDYAVKLKDHGRGLTGAMAVEFARHAGIGQTRLFTEVLPRLKAADLIAYTVDLADGLTSIEEFVGLSGRVIDQAIRVTEEYRPTDVEWAVLHSTELASWAPLTVSQHAEQLYQRGFADAVVREATRLTLATGVNQWVKSADLNEHVIYNPNVWSAHHVGIAAFLKTLPPVECDSLLGLCEQAAHKPGLVLWSYSAYTPAMLSSARKVGLVQVVTVKSSIGSSGPQTYVFSPILESQDDRLQTTEVLHQRKLFVSHILYGHDKAVLGRGRIVDLIVLVGSLLRKGSVGPASNIASDYHLLEANGIVSVRPAAEAPGRAYLELVKRDIIEGGLGWLQASRGGTGNGVQADLSELKPPSEWTPPEADRANQPDAGAATEIAESAILRLREARKEAASAARYDLP